jgi:hypothetical protein
VDTAEIWQPFGDAIDHGKKAWSQSHTALHLKSEMEPLPIHEGSQSIAVKLLGQVERSHQLLLSAHDECVQKAERHYRNLLNVFSGLILNGRLSDVSKAAHYLNLRRRTIASTE